MVRVTRFDNDNPVEGMKILLNGVNDRFHMLDVFSHPTAISKTRSIEDIDFLPIDTRDTVEMRLDRLTASVVPCLITEFDLLLEVFQCGTSTHVRDEVHQSGLSGSDFAEKNNIDFTLGPRLDDHLPVWYFSGSTGKRCNRGDWGA
ncbi:hypothetical protein HHX47_DHR2000980, partial [Lentinula edodes]